jgi:hypothetical protein
MRRAQALRSSGRFDRAKIPQDYQGSVKSWEATLHQLLQASPRLSFHGTWAFEAVEKIGQGDGLDNDFYGKHHREAGSSVSPCSL